MHRQLATLAWALLLGATAPATTFSRESTGDLVRRAERVCCARCESVVARRDPKSGIVFSHVKLRLLEDLKGRAADTIELRLAGGRAEGVETVVPGMPHFRPGMESVLLLGGKNRAGYRVLLQAKRGVLPLVRGKDGRRRLGTPVTGIEELKAKRRVSMDDFRGAVKRIVRAQQRERAK